MNTKMLGAVLLALAGGAWAQMPADIAAKLRQIGPVLNPQMIQATFDLYIPGVPKAVPGVSSLEDLAYGPNERHRLDVFAPAAGAGRAMPVVLFVPGGGYVAGAILQSPVLDPAGAPPGPNLEAYFGPRAGWADRSLLRKLDGRKIPVFLVYAELDPKPFRDQAALLSDGLAKRDGGAAPPTLDLPGHNHISEIAHLGSSDDTAFGQALLEFVKTGQ